MYACCQFYCPGIQNPTSAWDNYSSVISEKMRGVYGRTIEIPQRTRISKTNCSLKVPNAFFKLLLSILG